MDEMHAALDLTLEQRFTLAKYEPSVRGLSREEAQTHLLEMMRQLMIKDNVIRHLVRQTL